MKTSRVFKSSPVIVDESLYRAAKVKLTELGLTFTAVLRGLYRGIVEGRFDFDEHGNIINLK